MTEKINVQEQIGHLLKLQEMDSEIYKLEAEKDSKPEEITSLKGTLSQKQSGLKSAEDNLKALQLKHKDKEMMLGTKEAEIKKLQTQLYQLKTNKEYSAMLSEIERHKADNSLLEEDILKLMDEIDAAKVSVSAEKKKFDEESKKIDAEVRAIEERVKDIEAIVADLKIKRQHITPSVSPRLLKEYERILEGRGGLAIVAVENNACGGCFMQMRSQTINEIQMKEEIIHCGNCQRILYLKDDAAQA